jgi:NAD(P)-dependent dehydrogenase (short-subunit alcohol dehydrogenase family)
MVRDIFSLKGKVFVITGGLGQLGQVYLNEVLSRGGKVAILDILEVDSEMVMGLIDKLNKNYFLYINVNVTKKIQIQNAVSKVLKKWERIDVLINNAALDSPPDAPSDEVGPFEEYPEESFDKVMDVNVKGIFLCCQIIGKVMAQQKNGTIINISSIYGLVSPRQDIYDFRRKDGNQFFKPIAYSVSKSSLYNLTRYLATYWAKDNVRVNTLTLAGILNNQPKEFLESYNKNIPVGRMLDVNETVGPMIFLASNASSYMTGANLVIDGGWTAW